MDWSWTFLGIPGFMWGILGIFMLIPILGCLLGEWFRRQLP